MDDTVKLFDGVAVCDGEAVEPLDDAHSIIQPVDGYRFGGDAIALFKYAAQNVLGGARAFDLCSGCGIIGISLALAVGCEVSGAELDTRLCDMSNRSCAVNGLDRVEFRNVDIKHIDRAFKRASYDVVTCNPPFFKADSKPRAVAPAANSELTATFDDIARAAAYLLKDGGAAYFVHTAARLDEILHTCRERGLMPKELTVNVNGKTFLLKCVRGAKQGLVVKTSRF